MTTFIAGDIVQTTAYNALANAVNIVVKAHTLIESKNIVDENNIDGTSTNTTPVSDNNIFTDKQSKPNIVNEAKGNSKKKTNRNQKTQQKSPLITLRMLKKVEAELKIICEESRERFIPDGLFFKLMPALDEIVKNACKTKLYPGGLQTFKETHTCSTCGMEAAIIILEAITANDVDSRIIDQDRIELCIKLCKHYLTNLIFPIFTNLSDIKQKGLQKTVFKWTQEIHVGISELFTYLKRLVNKIPVTDSLLLQVTSLSMDILTLDADKLSRVKEQVKNLQLDSISLMQQIFSSHSQHRSAIFEEIFGILHKLPGYHSGNSSGSKRNLRLYSLIGLPIRLASPGIDLEKKRNSKRNEYSNEHIMMVTALILQLVHASYIKPTFFIEHESLQTNEEPKHVAKDSQNTKHLKKYKRKIMKMTVKDLRNECAMKKLKKSGKKSILQERLLSSYELTKDELSYTSSSSDDDEDNDEYDDNDYEGGGEIIAKQNEEARIQSNTTPQYLLRFLKILVARSSMSNSRGADDSYRRFLSNFVTDLLRVVTRAEWPGAEKVLTILTRLLTNVTHKEKSSLSEASRKNVDASFRNLSIELLGKIASIVKCSIDYLEKNKLTFPVEIFTSNYNPTGNPDDLSETWACVCGIRGKGKYEKILEMDCDSCHRWHHAQCHGYYDESDIGDVWYCDECRILQMLQNQRNAMKRRHNIQTGQQIVNPILNSESNEENKFNNALKDIEKTRQTMSKLKKQILSEHDDKSDAATDVNNQYCVKKDDSGTFIQLDNDLLSSRNLVVDRQFILNQLHLNKLTIDAQDDETHKCTRQYTIEKWYHSTTKAEEQEMYMINWNLPDEYNHESVVLSKGGLNSRRNAKLMEDELYRHVTRAPTLTNRANIMIALELACAKPLFQSSSRLLKHVLQSFADTSGGFRARAMKALANIVDANPSLIGDDDFESAVRSRFTDSSASVRQSCVDLIGNHIGNNQQFALKYHDHLIKRMRDKAVSVRKSAIKILQNVLLNIASYKRRTDIMLAFAERMNESTETYEIKNNLVMVTFEKLWFIDYSISLRDLIHDGSGIKVGNSSKGKSRHKKQQKQSTVLTKKYLQAENMYSNRIAHDIVNFIAHLTGGFEWVIEMLKKALHIHEKDYIASSNNSSTNNIRSNKKRKLVASDGNYSGGKSDEDVHNHNSAVHKHLTKIATALVNGLLVLDAGETLHIFNIEFDLNLFNKTILKRAIFATLRVFAMAEPQLLLPHTPSFCIYLKGDNDEEARDNNEIISNAALILTELIPAWQTYDENVIEELETDLQNIMYRRPPHVCKCAAKCWKALHILGKVTSKRIEQTALAFYNALWQYRLCETMQGVSIQHQGSVHRSLSNLGLLCQTYDFDDPERTQTALLRPREPINTNGDDNHIILNYGGGMLVKGHTIKQVLNIYMHYLTNGIAQYYDNGNWRVKAIEGLGAVFVRRPKYMLTPGVYADGNEDDDSTNAFNDKVTDTITNSRYTLGPRDIIENTLTSNNSDVRRTMLQTLCSIVEEEECRITEAHRLAIKNSGNMNYADQVYGDQDGDSSIASAVIQVHQNKFRSMLLDGDNEVRSMCLTLISTLLRQGMMNPLPFIIPLEVLTSDRNTEIARMAFRAVLKIDEKASAHVCGKFVDAICASYHFQKRVYENVRAISDENIIDEGEKSSGRLGYSGYLSLFSRMYTKIVQNTESKFSNNLNQSE
jgi:hypothetical protein